MSLWSHWLGLWGIEDHTLIKWKSPEKKWGVHSRSTSPYTLSSCDIISAWSSNVFHLIESGSQKLKLGSVMYGSHAIWPLEIIWYDHLNLTFWGFLNKKACCMKMCSFPSSFPFWCESRWSEFWNNLSCQKIYGIWRTDGGVCRAPFYRQKLLNTAFLERPLVIFLTIFRIRLVFWN